ncbi:MAG: inositol monophosphatase [Candidatus Pristimantibacillus sp.]
MDYLNLAKSLAISAGELIKSRMGEQFLVEEKSSAFDVVTEVDKLSENLIREGIAAHYPDHQFLGEEEMFLSGDSLEEVLSGSVDEPYLWIVDPIDGTSNFVQGIPGFTVSIALACKGELIVGVVYDPCADEMFWAEKGQGAFMNGKRIEVSGKKTLETCVIATGFPSNMEARLAVYNGLGKLIHQCRTIRSLGSAARHLAYVGAARLDGFWENGLKAWDVAAGVLIVLEAGGQVSDTSGNPYSLKTMDIVTTNGQVHSSLLDCLK